MSSQPTTPNVDAVDEELVAYLDGELDAANRQQVERRLADDASFRTRLRRLQQTWDALDVLGRTDADEKFTRTTVELVAVKAAEDVQQQQSLWARRRTWHGIAWALLAATTATAGWLLLTLLLTSPNQALLRDLSVIERVDEYRNADSYEFIHELDESGLFASEAESELTSANATASATNQGHAASRIKNLKPEEKAKLNQKNERFAALSPQEQDQLRRLHQQIDSAPSAKRLVLVLDRYSRWLKTLSPSQQSELMSMPIDERLAEIKKIQQRQIQSQFWDLAWQLEKNDLETIFAWMEEFVAENQGEILRNGDPRWQARVMSARDEKWKRRMLLGSVFGMRRQDESAVLPSGDDFLALATRVSPTLQYQLTLQKSDEDRRKLLMTCAQFAWMSQWAPPPPKDEELSRFYASTDLKPADRERVEKLEPQQMKRELTKLYHFWRFRKDGWQHSGAPEAGGSPGPYGPSRGEGSRSRRDGERRPQDSNNSEPPMEPAQNKGGPVEAEPPEKLSD